MARIRACKLLLFSFKECPSFNLPFTRSMDDPVQDTAKIVPVNQAKIDSTTWRHRRPLSRVREGTRVRFFDSFSLDTRRPAPTLSAVLKLIQSLAFVMVV